MLFSGFSLFFFSVFFFVFNNDEGEGEGRAFVHAKEGRKSRMKLRRRWRGYANIGRRNIEEEEEEVKEWSKGEGRRRSRKEEDREVGRATVPNVLTSFSCLNLPPFLSPLPSFPFYSISNRSSSCSSVFLAEVALAEAEAAAGALAFSFSSGIATALSVVTPKLNNHTTPHHTTERTNK